MSSTDLLNGPISGLPTYNVKNNPSVFNFNSIEKINYFRQLLLAISYNHVFFDVVTDLKNLGRDYYNKNPRKFCSTIQLSPVKNYQNKEITVYLPSAGGVIDNSIEYVKMDYNRNTWLMRVLQNQKLPTCWSNVIKDGYKCVNYSVDPSLLTPNEKVLYYYIKNADFFTRTLQLLVNSFRVFSEQRFQCFTLVFPKDLYAGTKQERTFTVTNDFLRSIYSQYLRYSRLGNIYKLPAPIVENIPYIVPITNLTQSQLTEIINNNSDSFTI